MNFFQNHLTIARFESQEEHCFLRVEASTRFGYTAGPDGEPLRMDSKLHRVAVPTYDWSAQHLDEDEVIAKVLAEASMVSPLKLPSPKALDRDFWVRNNRHCKVFVMHPSLHGKFYIPVGPAIYKSDALPLDRITCVGVPQFTGYYIIHGHRRGVLVHDKKGLRSLQFQSVG